MQKGFMLVAAMAGLIFAGGTSPAQVQSHDPSNTRSPRFLFIASAYATPVDFSTAPILRRQVTANLVQVPLRDALNEIARQARIRLVYNLQTAGVLRTVSLEGRHLALAAALTQVLLDTGLDVVFSPNGEAALVPREAVGVRAGAGRVRGRVMDARSGGGIANVTVDVQGKPWRAITDQNGVYRIANVDAGDYVLATRRLGFVPMERKVAVAADQETVIDFLLTSATTTLTEVVTTATGERSRLEVGTSIGTIKADSVVPTTLIRNMSDLLTARTPGVVVSNISGLVGAPSKIRIRGINSLSLNNDPIIILDGIRLASLTTVATSQVNTGAATNVATVGGTAQVAPSRLDDIDPNTIETIDVLRGPSASSLYGTEAANGVIVIKTKKGQVGTWRTTLLADDGWSSIPGRMPDQWRGWGHGSGTGVTGANATQCVLAYVLGRSDNGGVSSYPSAALGTCIQDSVTHFNPENDPLMRTLGTGESRNLSANLSGGSAQLQEFLSIRVSDNVGMAQMSEVQKHIISRLWSGPPPSWMLKPNTEGTWNGSSRTSVQISPKLDMDVNANVVYRNVLNSGASLPAGGIGGWDTLIYLPSESQRAQQTSLAKRGFASTNANYVPWSWLTLHGQIGGDYSLRTDASLTRASDCTPALAILSTTACGSGHVNIRSETFITTMDVGAQLALSPLSWLTSRTAVGEQYNRTQFYGLSVGNTTSTTNLAFGTDLLTPAPVVVSGTPQLYSVTESRDESATAGWYAEQTLAIRERLFLTAALRQDAASAFGFRVNATAPIYPKYSVSWLLSDEPFFPRQSVVSTFRLRSAYGHSGNQASLTNVLNNYSQTQGIVEGNVVTELILNNLGNPGLRPERTTEWEGGFEASLFTQERLQLEVTLYRKLSEDAIVTVTLPPSFGAANLTSNGDYRPNLSESANVGSVENRGLEMSATAKLLDSRRLGWVFTVNWTENRNTLVHKAPSLSSLGALRTNFIEGYPLYGWWGYPVLSYADRNGDGILGLSEIAFGARAYQGAPYPTREITYRNSVTLFSGALRMNASLDQIIGLSNKLGDEISNNGGIPPGYTRCAVDPTCTLAQQAASMQARVQGRAIAATSSYRLSELSMTYMVPRSVARRLLRTQTMSLTVAGRNLALWTNYAGKDPNVDASGAAGDATNDNGLGIPQPRNWTLRLNIGL